MTQTLEQDSKDKDLQLDPVAEFIINYVQTTSRPASPEVIAKAFYEPRKREKDRPDAWKRYFQAVKQQSFFLHRQGLVIILRKGEPVSEIKQLKGRWVVGPIF